MSASCDRATGVKIPCLGDGYCWEIAVCASLAALEKPDRPTIKDYGTLSVFLDDMQHHLHADLSLAARFRKEDVDKFMEMTGDYKGVRLSQDNYGGAVLTYPVMASLLKVPILLLDEPMLKTDLDFSYGGGRNRAVKFVNADTPLEQFKLFEPNAEDSQQLSLRRVLDLLERKQPSLTPSSSWSLAVVVHNGDSGALPPAHKAAVISGRCTFVLQISGLK